MKTPIYTLLLIAFSVLSCSVDTIEDDFNSLEVNDPIENQKVMDLPMDENVCSRVALIANGKEIGVVDFTFENYQIKITYQTIDSWKMMSTNLGLIDIANETFSTMPNGAPMIHEFAFQDYYEEGRHIVTYTFDEFNYVETYAFAAQAIAIGPKNEKSEVWANGNYFCDESDAMYAQVTTLKCRANDYEQNYELDYCNDDNTKAYVCHNGNTLCVSINAIDAHLAHGDLLGKCED